MPNVTVIKKETEYNQTLLVISSYALCKYFGEIEYKQFIKNESSNVQGANIYLKKLGGSKQTVLMSGHHNGECDNAINVLNEQKPNISGK